MVEKLESIANRPAVDSEPACAHSVEHVTAMPPDCVSPENSHGIGLPQKLGLACSFAVALGIPALSIATLLAVRPILPASTQPVGAATFVFVFVYAVACLFAIGELTSRPLTPRSRPRRPKPSVFAAGIALGLAAPALVAASAPFVANTLLAKGIVCLQAALCAGAFAACLITSVRLYRLYATRAEAAEQRTPPLGTSDSAEEKPSSGWPAAAVLRIENGFARTSARALFGIGLASLAAGLAASSLLVPATIPPMLTYAAAAILLAVLALISVAIVRATSWMRIALYQWIGLLAGLTAGYLALYASSGSPLPETLVAAASLALFAFGLALLLAHPPVRVCNLPAMQPLPEPAVTVEAFCAEAAEAFSLTPREEQTLGLILEDLDPRDIADELGVTAKTAKAYERTICRKIGANNRDELADALDAWDASRCESEQALPRPEAAL